MQAEHRNGRSFQAARAKAKVSEGRTSLTSGPKQAPRPTVFVAQHAVALKFVYNPLRLHGPYPDQNMTVSAT